MMKEVLEMGISDSLNPGLGLIISDFITLKKNTILIFYHEKKNVEPAFRK